MKNPKYLRFQGTEYVRVPKHLHLAADVDAVTVLPEIDADAEIVGVVAHIVLDELPTEFKDDIQDVIEAASYVSRLLKNPTSENDFVRSPLLFTVYLIKQLNNAENREQVVKAYRWAKGIMQDAHVRKRNKDYMITYYAAMEALYTRFCERADKMPSRKNNNELNREEGQQTTKNSGKISDERFLELVDQQVNDRNLRKIIRDAVLSRNESESVGSDVDVVLHVSNPCEASYMEN